MEETERLRARIAELEKQVEVLREQLGGNAPPIAFTKSFGILPGTSWVPDSKSYLEGVRTERARVKRILTEQGLYSDAEWRVRCEAWEDMREGRS